MPVYEYTCSKCSEKFELLVRGGTRVACPSCRSKKVKKEFSSFAPRGGASEDASAFGASAGGAKSAAGSGGG